MFDIYFDITFVYLNFVTLYSLDRNLPTKIFVLLECYCMGIFRISFWLLCNERIHITQWFFNILHSKSCTKKLLNHDYHRLVLQFWPWILSFTYIYCFFETFRWKFDGILCWRDLRTVKAPLERTQQVEVL